MLACWRQVFPERCEGMRCEWWLIWMGSRNRAVKRPKLVSTGGLWRDTGSAGRPDVGLCTCRSAWRHFPGQTGPLTLAIPPCLSAPFIFYISPSFNEAPTRELRSSPPPLSPNPPFLTPYLPSPLSSYLSTPRLPLVSNDWCSPVLSISRSSYISATVRLLTVIVIFRRLHARRRNAITYTLCERPIKI